MGGEREAGFASFAFQPFHNFKGKPEMNLDEPGPPSLALDDGHF